MSLRIGANLTWLVPGVVGGSEEYTVRLLDSFARLGYHGHELTLIVNHELVDAHPELIAAFPTVVAPIPGGLKPARVAIESTWLALQTRAEHFDLVHHLGGTMPPVRSVPGIVTVHDLQPYAYPQNFTLTKQAYLRTTVPMSVRRAVAIVVLTQFTRDDVVERMGVDPDRILLVPPGIDPPVPIDPDRALGARYRYGIADRPFVLYPAISYPHKNHLMLVRAFARVAADDPEPVLVMTGGYAQAEDAIRAEVARLGLVDRVLRTGRIPRRDLDALYSEARALAFPSHYEGFGIPVLEAMSRGVPVISSSATALPEVVGSAGLLIDPDDVAGWSAALSELLTDDERCRELAEAGESAAASFSWSASAEALVHAYDVAAERLTRPGTGATR